MSRYVFKMPDLGEGTVAAEVVAWHVKAGDLVQEDQVMVRGHDRQGRGRDARAGHGPRRVACTASRATWCASAPNSSCSTRMPNRRCGEAAERSDPAPAPEPRRLQASAPDKPRRQTGHRAVASARASAVARTDTEHAAAVHARPRRAASWRRRRRVARRAKPASICDSSPARGPQRPHHAARISRPRSAAGGARGAPPLDERVGAKRRCAARTGTEEIKSSACAALIAQRMTEAAAQHPALRVRRGSRRHRARVAAQASESTAGEGRAALTYLPFIVAALARVLENFPQCNALYDAERGVLVRHRAVHVGVATQTPRRSQSAGRAPRRGARAARPGRRDPPRLRGRARRQGAARRTHGLDDHGHQPRQARRHRVDADHQRARGRDHRRQQGHRAPGRASTAQSPSAA